MYSQKISIHYHHLIFCIICAGITISFFIQELFLSKATEFLKNQKSITVQLFDISSTTNKKYPYSILLNYWSPENSLSPYVIKVWAQTLPPLEVGQKAIIQKPYIHDIKPSLSSHFKKERIIAHVFVPELEVIKKSENFSKWLNTWWHWRKNIHVRLIDGLSTNTKALVESLFLGLKNNDSLDYKPWQYWGISHYLARSGLHVVILLALLMPVLMLIPLGIWFRSLITVLVLTIYYLISWPTVSFMRAFFMFLLGQLCFINYCPIKSTHMVLVAAGLFLIINPYYLLFADFQLSFGLTFALATFLEYNRMNSFRTETQSIAS